MDMLLTCLIIQLMKKSGSYQWIGKRFKFLANLKQITDIDEDEIKFIIYHGNKDVTDRLVNGVDHLKDYLFLVIHNTIWGGLKSSVHIWKNFDNNPKNEHKFWNGNTFPSISNNRKIFWLTMIEERLNYLSIFSQRNDTIKQWPYEIKSKTMQPKCKKLSYIYQTVNENVTLNVWILLYVYYLSALNSLVDFILISFLNNHICITVVEILYSLRRDPQIVSFRHLKIQQRVCWGGTIQWPSWENPHTKRGREPVMWAEGWAASYNTDHRHKSW